MSGLRSRNKGARIERAVVAAFQDEGVAAEKMPLSGAAGGRFAGDVSVPILGRDERMEVKARASGFQRIYGWLEGNYGVVTKADRQPALITLRLSDFAHLVHLAEEERVLLEQYAEMAGPA